MRQYFNTREKAEKNLAIRRELAHKRVERDNDKVIFEKAFVHCVYNRKFIPGRYSDSRVLKWQTNLIIITKHMLRDLQKNGDIDFFDDLLKSIT